MNGDEEMDKFEKLVVKETKPSVNFGPTNLLRKKFCKTTMILWAIFFQNGYVMLGMIYILPDTLVTANIKMNVITGVLITIVIETFSTFWLMWIIDVPTIGRKNALKINLIMQCIFLGFCSLMSVDNYFIYFISGVKFFVSTNMTGCYIYSLEYYPTKIRSTGLGLGLAWARMAGILTPIISTILTDYNVNLPYQVFFGVNFLAIFAALNLDVETLTSHLD